MTPAQFNKIIRLYYKEHGRKLAWRETRDPYAILVSEIMLQQTQVSRVEGYYERFLKQFPNFRTLAKAKNESVLRAWAGLGYNRRAILLKRLAEAVVKDFHGELPEDRRTLESLPGIGKGTSGSLLAFVFNKPEIFIETNIRRVFIHFFFPRKKMVTDSEIMRYMERTIDRKNPREWYWALMDYGSSMTATGSGISANPNRRSAHYKKQTPFSGSDRELRGKILRIALRSRKIPVKSLYNVLNAPKLRIEKVLAALSREGFIGIKDENVCIK